MNRIQKISWLMVITFTTAILTAAVAVAAGVFYFKVGFPRAWAGLGFLGLAGLGGFGPLIFKKDPGPVQFDERDNMINLKAARGSFALSYLVFGVLCMGIWEYYRHQNIAVISIQVLPYLFAAAGFTVFVSHAIIILVLYGRDKTSKGDIK